jgi:hypothetical protein
MPLHEHIRADRLVKPSRLSAIEDLDVNNYDRDIGRLEAVAQSLERQIAEIKVERDEFRKEVKRLNDEITEIKDLVSQIKGGSRVLMWLGWLVSSGVGAALVKFGPMILVK